MVLPFTFGKHGRCLRLTKRFKHEVVFFVNSLDFFLANDMVKGNLSWIYHLDAHWLGFNGALKVCFFFNESFDLCYLSSLCFSMFNDFLRENSCNDSFFIRKLRRDFKPHLLNRLQLIFNDFS